MAIAKKKLHSSVTFTSLALSLPFRRRGEGFPSYCSSSISMVIPSRSAAQLNINSKIEVTISGYSGWNTDAHRWRLEKTRLYTDSRQVKTKQDKVGNMEEEEQGTIRKIKLKTTIYLTIGSLAFSCVLHPVSTLLVVGRSGERPMPI